MRTRLIDPRWLGVGLLAVLTATAAPSALAGSVRLDVKMSQPVLLARGQRTAYVYVGLTGLEVRKERRAPLNVAIVLDRSGSMAGTKLAEAKRAAIMAIDRLRPDDIVSVVTYETTVDVLVPATKLSDPETVRRAIRSIQSAGRTALFGGVSKGAAELGKFLDRNHVNTLVLLSDGLANVGPSSPGELAQLGISLARQGITVTTIGLGLDYNEDLMTRLASASDGNHFFVENASDLQYAFATEFGDALSAVAQGVEVRILCPPGVRPIRVLGREAQVSDREVRAAFKQLFKDQTRYVVVEVEVAPGRVGARVDAAQVDVVYQDLLSGARATAKAGAAITYSDSAAEVEARTNRDVMVAVVSQTGAERNELAMALRDSGKIEAARSAYAANSHYLAEQASALKDERLGLDAKANLEASQNLEGEGWKRERKVQQELQLKTKTQRATSPRGVPGGSGESPPPDSKAREQ